jgi:glucans biosynthesis protein C
MAERDNSWDALRALLMLLGIPFHAALPYSYYANTVVLSDDPSIWAEVLGNVLHSFRMATFFVVAGYFAAHAITRKGRSTWLADRWRSLAIPLVVGLVCFIPLQLFIRALDLANGGDDTGRILWMLVTTPAGHWTSHLWFLIVLLEYCLLTALVWNKVKPGLTGTGERLADYPPLLIAVFIVPLVLLPRLVLSMLGLDQEGPAVLLDLRRFAEYAPFFALGLMHFLTPRFLASFSKIRADTIAYAALACATFVVCDYVGLPMPGLAAKVVAGTLMGAVLIGLARRFFSDPRAIVRWFVGAAFTIYLFHFPIVCVTAYLLEGVEIGSEARMAITIAVALAGSCLIHVAISRSRMLLLLFNGRPFAAGRSRSAGITVLQDDQARASV